ncbi:hypothetical protein J1N35_024763, partial [Gossypium stocksii]
MSIRERRLNWIRGLQNVDGNVATSEDEVEEIARNYFTGLFASKGTENLEHVLSRVDGITNNMNQLLLAKYIARKVFAAHIIGAKVSLFSLDVLNG